MRIGGLSTKSPLSIIRSNYETYKIFNNLAYGQWTLKEMESGEAWENITKNKY